MHFLYGFADELVKMAGTDGQLRRGGAGAVAGTGAGALLSILTRGRGAKALLAAGGATGAAVGATSGKKSKGPSLSGAGQGTVSKPTSGGRLMKQMFGGNRSLDGK